MSPLEDWTLPDEFAELALCRGIVDDLTRVVDGKFSGLGQVVAELMADNVASTRRARELESFVRRKDALVSAYQLFKKARDAVEANLERTRELDEQLAIVHAQLEVALAWDESIGESIAVFWVLTTSMRIEAASLCVEDRAVILQLAGSMDTIHDELKSLMRQQLGHLAHVRGMIVDIRARLSKSRRENHLRLERSGERIDRILVTLQATLSRTQGIDSRVQEHSNRVDEHFSRIIVALQFQDIVRQKLESVLRSFDLLLTPWIEGGRDRHLAWAHQVATIEARQLLEACEQIEQASQTLTEHAQGLADVSEASLRATTDMQRSIITALERSRASGAFVENLGDLQQAVISTSAIARDVHQIVEEIHARLLREIGWMSGFAYQLRLVALNAQVHSSRLPAGTGLDELSVQTRQTSEQMRVSTERLRADVQCVLPHLESIDANMSELLAMSTREQESLGLEAALIEEQLREMEVTISGRFVDLTRGFTEMRTRITDAVHAARFGIELKHAFATGGEAFQNVVDTTADYAQAALADPMVVARIQSLRSDYVMDGQRTVHDRAIAAQSPAPSIDSSHGDDRASLGGSIALEPDSGLGDNVELF